MDTSSCKYLIALVCVGICRALESAEDLRFFEKEKAQEKVAPN
jgi:hypothetical protein